MAKTNSSWSGWDESVVGTKCKNVIWKNSKENNERKEKEQMNVRYETEEEMQC